MKSETLIKSCCLLATLLFATFVASVPNITESAAGQPNVKSNSASHAKNKGKVEAAGVVANNQNFPVAIAFTPDGRLLFAELLSSKIRVMSDGILQKFAYVNVKDVPLRQIMGLAVHPDFENNPYVYAYQTYKVPADVQATHEDEPDDDGNIYRNRVVRYTDFIGPLGHIKGVNMLIIIDNIPGYGGVHNGGILEFGPDGKLYISTSDAHHEELPQDLTSLGGKILRVNPDGSIPDDNPFPGSPIYSYGHRNVFGMDFHPVTGQLFVSENGPKDNDEINIIVPGGNYGWPIVKGIANDPNYIDPIWTYTPTIAPTNMVFYTGDKYCDEAENSLLLGDYNNKVLRRIVLQSPDYDEVISDDIVKTFLKPPIDVELGPDGFIYVSTPVRINKVQSLDGVC
jgi:glucose/arabinose dehydrogenase